MTPAACEKVTEEEARARERVYVRERESVRERKRVNR